MAKPTSSLRIPPQNIESERALLGSLLLRPVSMNDIADIIVSDAFYVDKHKIIYQTMLDLHKKREPLDTLSVSSRLKERGELENIGGIMYLTDLTGSVPSSSNADYYAEIVNKKFALRNLIDVGNILNELGFNETDDIEEIMDNAEKKVFAITQSPKGHQFTSIKDILPDVWDSIEMLHEHKVDLRGIPTGFKSLDNKLSGLQKSDLIILAARPSIGKTSLALDIARQSALRGTAVAFFSLEMSAQQLTDRMLAAQSRVDLWKIRTGKGLTESDFGHIRDAMGTLSSAPIYIDDQAANSILRMRATARRLKSQYSLGLIIVDYMQLMTTTKNYESMVNQVTEISRSLKSLARELDVPVLALSQLSRAIEARGGRPKLSDLRDSGAIEQDADVVMFIHREKNEEGAGKNNQTEVLIEKHRNGPTGVARLFFDEHYASFLDIETNNFEDFEDTSNNEDEEF